EASPPLPDLRGVDCVLAMSAEFDAEALASDLALAGASAQCVREVAEALALASRSPAPVLVVHDEGRQVADMRHALAGTPALRKVVLTRKPGLHAEPVDGNTLALYGNGLGRTAFL